MLFIRNSNILDPKLFCLHFKECDPKKCTALKLNKLGILNIMNGVNKILKRSIVLNPFAQKEINSDDRKLILKYGLVVIDCSWKKLLKLKDLNFGVDRKLPPLIAANPTNYGKWEKLSSAEALAAALYITKFKTQADTILSKFSWGTQFKKLNNF